MPDMSQHTSKNFFESEYLIWTEKVKTLLRKKVISFDKFVQLRGREYLPWRIDFFCLMLRAIGTSIWLIFGYVKCAWNSLQKLDKLN